MQQKPLPPKPPTQRTDDNTHITRLVNAGLMKRSQLPALRMAMKNFGRTQDVARLPKQQRDVLTTYNTALQKAAFGSSASISAIRRNVADNTELNDEMIAEEIKILEENYQPPQVLVLRRTGIRIFPDGMRVALYSNERMKVKFSVPYSSTGITDSLPNVTAEEVEVNEENIDENIEHIKDIVDKQQAKKLKFLDGTSMNVDATTAKAIHLVHGALNDENKAKVARMLSHSKGQFMKVADFALKNTAFK